MALVLLKRLRSGLGEHIFENGFGVLIFGAGTIHGCIVGILRLSRLCCLLASWIFDCK